MLEKFRQAKTEEIAALIRLQEQGQITKTWTGQRPAFAAALTRPGSSGIIAEYKRASPSKGDINPDVSPLDACTGYAQAGACALSILTEDHYFKGHRNFLAEVAPLGLPMLRKDFILHPVQVEDTTGTPASAILLIVRMLTDDMLGALHTLCLAKGLEPVVEVFDESDLERAKNLGARIIQVNSRNLDTLETDPTRFTHLVRRKEHGEIWIAASGISTAAQIAELRGAGMDACLIGTALMRHADPGQGLVHLVRGVS